MLHALLACASTATSLPDSSPGFADADTDADADADADADTDTDADSDADADTDTDTGTADTGDSADTGVEADTGDSGEAAPAWDPADLNGTYVEEGTEAPEFDATNRDDTPRDRDNLLGHPTVIWFYPAAATGG